MIFSHLKYGVAVWHHGNITIQKKLQIAMNKFMRIVFSMGFRDSVRETMAENEVLSLNQLFEKEIAIFQHKFESRNLPKHFDSLYEGIQRTTSMVTRSHASHNPTLCKTEYTKQNITHMGPKIWNSIPQNIKCDISNESITLSSVKYFKNKIKKYCIENISFYACT